MSYSFVARFSPTAQAFGDALMSIEKSLAESGLHFGGEVTRLKSRSGFPVADFQSTTQLSSSSDIYSLCKKWWGIGMLYTSQELRDELGFCTAIEVDVALHRIKGGGLQVSYTEGKGAFHARLKKPDLGKALATTLAKMCLELDVGCALYEEESDDEALNTTSVGQIRDILADSKRNDCKPPWLAVVHRSLLTLEEAKKMAGRNRACVRLLGDDFVLLSFLGE